MDSWVIVQTFINPQEAYMAKAFLESAGIETRMQDELTVRTGIHAQAIGGVKLLVRHECWQEALRRFLPYSGRPGSAVVVEKLGNINNLNDEKIDSFYTIVARLFGSY